MLSKEYVSEADRLRAYALQERAAVRRMQVEGECTGEDRPRCYETCPHSYYCSELRHVLPALSML